MSSIPVNSYPSLYRPFYTLCLTPCPSLITHMYSNPFFISTPTPVPNSYCLLLLLELFSSTSRISPLTPTFLTHPFPTLYLTP
jgi:hypothetical protein